MTFIEDFVDKIFKTFQVKGDLDFLFKLAPREIVVSTAHLKGSIKQRGKNLRADPKPPDFISFL